MLGKVAVLLVGLLLTPLHRTWSSPGQDRSDAPDQPLCGPWWRSPWA